jgi:hypothetical protein
MISNEDKPNSKEQWSIWEPRVVKISRSLWNATTRYRVRKSPKLAYILSKIKPNHSRPSYFFKTHFNIILPSKLISSRSFPFRFSDETFYAFLISLKTKKKTKLRGLSP